MASRSIDEALMGVNVQLELVKARQEVQKAEHQARKPRAYLPSASSGRQLAPHMALRTALFGALADKRKKGGVRQFVSDKQIAGLANMRVLFTGQLLDQQDLDVLMAVLEAAHGRPLGGSFVTPARQLLLAQRKSDDGRNYAHLEASLKRLAGAVLDVQQGGEKFIGSLLWGAIRPRAGDAWSVRVNPDIVKLFEPGGFTSLDVAVRSALHGKPLAKWLHGYYSSQPQGHALRLETVRLFSGSTSKDLRSFRQTLVKALGAVAIAMGKHGQSFNWELDKAGLLRLRR